MKITPEIITNLLTLLGFIGSLIIWGMSMERQLSNSASEMKSAAKIEQMRFEETGRRIDAIKHDIIILEQQQKESWLKQRP